MTFGYDCFWLHFNLMVQFRHSTNY